MRVAVAARRGGEARRAACRGYTAIEVIVAALLLTVGLLATSQLVIMASTQVALSRQQSDAATLAANTIEQYRDVAFASLVPGTYTTTPTVGAITYRVRTVVDATNVIQTGTDRITVTVTWGGGQSYVTSTIIGPLQ